jgi:hypothetical protein
VLQFRTSSGGSQRLSRAAELILSIHHGLYPEVTSRTEDNPGTAAKERRTKSRSKLVPRER